MTNWVVGFLDMLGYRSVLAELDAHPLPDDKDEQAELGRAFGRALQLRRRLLGQVDALVGKIVPPPAELDRLPNEQRAAFLATKPFQVLRDPGADHIVLGASLAPSDSHFPMRAVLDVLTSAALLALMQLYIAGDDPGLALPIRGGIALAPGVLAQPENFLYSPALTCAYVLESEHARTPRILVDSRVVEYLDAHKADAEHGITGMIAKTLASTARDLIVDDKDGKAMLDFYGPALARMLKGAFTAAQSATALGFVRQSLADATVKGNASVMSKYQWLADYMESRASHWPRS